MNTFNMTFVIAAAKTVSSVLDFLQRDPIGLCSATKTQG